MRLSRPHYCLLVLLSCASLQAGDDARFKAGAASIDISPTKFPVIVNGMFTSRATEKVIDPIYARALVLDDGQVRIAIVIVDSCMVPRKLLDQVKELAQKSTGIPTARMLIASTHTHSAPAAMGCLGTDADPDYPQFLLPKLVQAIEQANAKLQPAKIGWTVVQAPEFTNCRRWIRRPDKIGSDPFGKPTVRANMHPGHLSPDVIGPSGPIDPDLSLVSIQTTAGKPLALLSNYSMHYYGSGIVSSDYFGQYCNEMEKLLGGEKNEAGVVAIMANGCCGDLHWMNYAEAAPKTRDYKVYAQKLAAISGEALKTIQHHDAAPLAMAEAKLTLNRRVPDAERLAWAQKIMARVGKNLPAQQPEIYAREAIYLHEDPTAELKLQALKVGTLGMVSWPNEVFGISGLKIKLQSPLQPVFNIELANGAEGYIPPPEQHVLGGYTTWPARTAGLEPQAETKIVEQLLQLLEQVSGEKRRPLQETSCAYSDAVKAGKPLAYWRMGEINRGSARDESGNNAAANFEDGVVFYLEGADAPGLQSGPRGNRAAHFAGGRLKAAPELGTAYTVEFWFWNGLPADARAVSAYLFSRGSDGAAEAAGDHLGIGGKDSAAGKLFFVNGNKLNTHLAGTTMLKLKTWHHVALVRDGKNVRVHLDGNATPEISGEAEPGHAPDVKQIFLGGHSDNFANLEGKLDEVAVYGRALSAEEIAQHYKAAKP